MRGWEGGVKKRKGTSLSLYYPSVTGLLGSYYGYSDSRLSVLLTIAHKDSIQLSATMQITRSHFLSASFFLHFVLFMSGYIFTHIFLLVSALSLSEALHRAASSKQHYQPTVWCFYPCSYSSLCFSLSTRPISPSP